MNNYDLEIRYVGFAPSEKVIELAKRTADRIYWESPSDSALNIEILKSRGLYQYRCQIHSVQGHFQVEGASEIIRSALALLEGDMLRRLEGWKMQRSLRSRGFDIFENNSSSMESEYGKC